MIILLHIFINNLAICFIKKIKLGPKRLFFKVFHVFTPNSNNTKKEIRVITNYPNLFFICFYNLLQLVELNTHPR